MTLLFVSYQVVFIDDQKLHDKKVNIVRSKKAFKVREKKKKHLSSFIKSFQFKGFWVARDWLRPKSYPSNIDLFWNKKVLRQNKGWTEMKQ